MKTAKYDPNNLCRFFAESITSRHNQHVQVRVVASAGMGKSYLGLNLSEGTAVEIANIIGGKPEDYFCFEKDLAVMSTEEIQRVLCDPGKYHVIMLDDIGVGVGARDFQKNSNKDLAKIIQTFRPNNNLIIETMQAGFLVDKIFRLLAHYEIEIESTNFDYGYVVAKVQEIEYKHKKDKVYYPYLYHKGNTYVRHMFQKPSEGIVEKYEIERAKQLKRIMDREKESNNVQKKTLKDIVIPLHKQWVDGNFKELSWNQVCLANNINYDSANVLLSKERSKT